MRQFANSKLPLTVIRSTEHFWWAAGLMCSCKEQSIVLLHQWTVLREEKDSVEPNTRDIPTMCSVFPTHSHCPSCLFSQTLTVSTCCTQPSPPSLGFFRCSQRKCVRIKQNFVFVEQSDGHGSGACVGGGGVSSWKSSQQERHVMAHWSVHQTVFTLLLLPGKCSGKTCCCTDVFLRMRRKLSRPTASLTSGGSAERRALWILEVDVCVTADWLLTSLILHV